MSDRSKRIPSEINPTSAERLRAKRNAKLIVLNGEQPTHGPHYSKLLEYLNSFTGTKYERQIWEEYFRRSRPAQRDIPIIEETARDESLSFEEYQAREVLKQLQKFSIANNINAPNEAYYLGDGRIEVDGTTIKLSDREKAVIEPLVKQRAMTLSELRKASGYEDANKIIGEVIKRYPAISSMIKMPGGKSKGGYSTTIIAR